MNARVTLYSICLTLLMVCAGCGADSTETFTPTDTNATFAVSVSQPIEIVLESNITTGYGWQLAEPLNDSLLELAKHRYVADSNPSGLVGVGGVEVWTFMPLRAGSTSISLHYLRPWDTTSVAKTAQFPVTISE